MPKILLVGCGKMGRALLGGMLKGFAASDILVVEANLDAVESIKNDYGVEVVTSLKDGFNPDVVIFAVKPQAIGQILPDYKGVGHESTLYISVIAGKNIDYFAEALGKEAKIVRSMPNLPALIGYGITALCPNAGADDRELVESIFTPTGKVVWLSREDEHLIDAVTAISGSGPAYIFHMAECLHDAGKKLGLSESIARDLAYQTILGSAEMLAGADAGDLREKVTSPNGTTQAALDVLMGELPSLIEKTTKAAQKRAYELAKGQ